MHELLGIKRGEELPQSKLTEEDVRLIRELHAWKMEQAKELERRAGIKALAEKFDVHVRTIEKALVFKSWRHVV